ncbi:MAG: tetratricopeptide repeat protein [Deltaproteobacteria bacterium]|nr:tetratricopeptide repeat protein [Deltaproteobacteria bacterium]
MATLRAELSAVRDRATKAVLLYELAHALEVSGDLEGAIRDYDAARKSSTSFRLPLFALIRLYEERGETKLLGDLLAAEAKVAGNPAEEVSAMLAQATLLEDRLDRGKQARALYVSILGREPGNLTTSLMLERTLRANGDTDAAAKVVATRAEYEHDPVTKRVLLLEGALDRKDAGDLTGALEMLRGASGGSKQQARILGQLERLSRNHGLVHDRIEVMERLATIAERRAKGEAVGQGLSAGELPPFADERDAKGVASALLREVAGLLLSEDDGKGALSAIGRAIQLSPDDLLLRYERLAVYERLDDLGNAQREAQLLTASGGPTAAAVHLRIADLAARKGNQRSRRDALTAAVAADPGSVVATALLEEELHTSASPGERIAWLTNSARAPNAPDRQRLLWRAARIAAYELGDQAHASKLYVDAANAGSALTSVLRDCHGAALYLRDDALTMVAVEGLLDSPELSAEERGTLSYERYRRLRSKGAGSDGNAAAEALLALAEDEARPSWAGYVQRLSALEARDLNAAASAHLTLEARAESAGHVDLALGHRAAAGRALGRAGDFTGAAALLREAMARAPGDEYVRTLLEEAFRAEGSEAELAALLIDAGDGAEDARIAEPLLVRAAYAAREAGDVGLAFDACRRAAAKSPTSVVPRWAMLRIAADARNDERVREAIEALSERELAVGRASLATLTLGEERAYRVEENSDGKKELLAALGRDTIGAAAAATLLITGSDMESRTRAVERLLEEAHGPTATALRRTLGGMLLFGLGTGEAVDDLVKAVITVSREDRWGRWAALRLTGVGAAGAKERSLAFEGLGAATNDAAVGSELLLYALWSDAEESDERREQLREEIDALDSAGLLTALAAEGAMRSTSTADALEARVGHASPEVRPAMEAAMGRALVLGGRFGEALAVLTRATQANPEDLASWEALRVAARAEQAYELVVEASDRLADRAPEGLSASMCAEAGLLLEGPLERPAEAEPRLKSAFAVLPERRDLFKALRRILSAKDDRQGLLDLVRSRIAVVYEPHELTALRYEEAELAHALEQPGETVSALENLLALNPDHAPALALMAVSQMREGKPEQAVVALRSLATVDLPAAERKDARLAAAKILMGDLDDPQGAYRELEVIENMGAADEHHLSLMALLAERAQMHEEAVGALTKAAALTTGAAQARYEMRAAVIHRVIREDRAAASDAYRRALGAVPTDLSAAAALAELLDRAGRRRLSVSFDAAVREEMDVVGTTPNGLRKLRATAQWAEDEDYEWLILDALAILGHASDAEATALDDLHDRRRRHGGGLRSSAASRGHLSAEALAALGALAGDDNIAELVDVATGAALTVDGADTDGLGVGRRELVKIPKGRSDSPECDEVLSLGEMFGVDADRVYVGGSPVGGAALVGSRLEPAAWVVVKGQTPFEAGTRFRVGTLAMAHHLGALPLISRNVKDGVSFVAAVASAGGHRMGDAAADPERTNALRKALSRGSRKSLERLSFTADEAAVRAHCLAVRSSCLRAGMAVCADLEASLTMVLGAPPTAATVAASESALDLFAFWLSPEHRALRSELGLSAVAPARAAGSLDQAAAQLERSSGFFGVRADEVAWAVDAEDLLPRVNRTGPREGSLVAVSHQPLIVIPDAEERLEVVLALSKATGDAGLLLSAEELAEAAGKSPKGRVPAARRDSSEDANAAVQDGDVVDMLRARAAALSRGAWDEVAELLEAEAALPTKGDQRGLVLGLLAVVCFTRLGDVARARKAAASALTQRPKSAALTLLSALLTPRNEPETAAATLERAARHWDDGKAGAALLVEAAHQTERSGDLTRARFLFKRAVSSDPDALDATIGLARTAFSQRGVDEAAEALSRAAEMVNDRHLREAFQRAAARMLHIAGNKPALAAALLAEATESPAVEALAIAAEAARDRDALTRAAEACASANRRTGRALWLVHVAELRSEDGDARGAAQAIRDAAHADQTLDLIRVVGESIARRSGDRRELARVARNSGLGPLAASARVAFDAKSASYELRLLMDAVSADGAPAAALLVSTDANAEAGDREALDAAARREAETLPGDDRPSRLLAIADLLESRGDLRGSARVLREVRQADPKERIAIRRLAELLRERAPQKAAVLWRQEGEVASADAGAAAHLFAARLLADSGGDGSADVAAALDQSPGYPPALWTNEARARKSNDPGKPRALVLARAEEIPDPRSAAESLIRAAFTAESPDAELLGRASDLIPEDIALGDVRLRLGGLSATDRAELLENAGADAPAPIARAMHIRAAEAWGEAGDHHRATGLLDGLEGRAGDTIAARLLHRSLAAAGDLERLRKALGDAVLSATDDASRALYLERLADFELHVGESPERAAAAYREILALYPSHVASMRAVERLAMRRGENGDGSGDEELAAIAAERARIGSSAAAAAHARLAARLERLGGKDGGGDANARADKVLRHIFDYGEVDLWLAREVLGIALRTGDDRLQMQAWGELSDLLETPRERMAAELRLAEVASRTHSPNAAENRLTRSMPIDPTYPGGAEILGHLREAAGNAVGAAEAYEDAGRRAHSGLQKARVAILAGTLYEGEGDPGRAAKAYFSAAKGDPKTGDALERLVRLLPVHERAKDVAALLAQRIPLGGAKAQVADLHEMLARIKLSLGDAGTAQKNFRMATTLDPERFETLEELAEACVANKDLRGAADALHKVIFSCYDAVIVHRCYLALATVRAEQQDIRRTKEVLHKMLEMFPDDDEAKQRLARIDAQ